MKKIIIAALLFAACSDNQHFALPSTGQLAAQYFGEDSQWYVDNVPFFECSDKQIEQVYYYRWKLYKAHIRNVGPDQFVITEFINHVPWDREPYCTINAAAMHHIYEGRWLRDNRYLDGYINYMYHDGGNNRQYSESVADAAYARYLVNADSAFIVRQLDGMKSVYEGWSDHWDSSKHLYYIAAMPDATEYTIASIDASGGKDGFEDGEAFRPTINSYQYGNAKAIAAIAALEGDADTRQEYVQKANALRQRVLHDLWNDSLKHFTDRFKVDNRFVHYWNFIRGRELAGLIPWYFNLPADSSRYSAAWRHATDTSQLLGKYGFRTNEPSYEYYFKQFVYFEGKRGSQWNGPSWPYQSSLVLNGMANVLNNYNQNVIAASDYLKLLRLYTGQHYLPDGRINLVENYDPNNGGPIVHYYWSNHYNHSSYNNLVITGLCGIRPSEGSALTIHPLVDSSIRYFSLQDVMYHGHRLTLVYDEDGNHYKAGKGLTVWVDGKKVKPVAARGSYKINAGPAIIKKSSPHAANVALNIRRKEFPVPSASINTVPDSLYQAVDGRIWYFPEISNRWTTLGSTAPSDWYALNFGEPREISTVKIYPFADGKTFFLPDSLSIELQSDGEWKPAGKVQYTPAMLLRNTANTIQFMKTMATGIRINVRHGSKAAALVEVECY